MDTVPGNRIQDPGKAAAQSTISRFSCRILCSREEPEHTARVFAAGFDTSRNIFLGEKATKWETEHQVEIFLRVYKILLCFYGASCPLSYKQS